MSLDEAILDLIQKKPGCKAAEIARDLGAERTRVNSALYGPLKTRVRQDAQYRWWPLEGTPTPAQQAKSAPVPKTSLGHLCQYYLDCTSQELEAGVSVFASSKFNLDYAELTSNPFDDTLDTLAGEPVRRVFERYRSKKQELVLVLGYPTRLRFVRSRRTNWEGFMVDPVLLFPIEVDAETGPRLAEEAPTLNFSVLSAFNTLGAGRTMEEAIQLTEELGLWTIENGIPDPDELVLRLRSIRPEWDWREEIDPTLPSTGPPLADLKQAGIYNRVVVLTAERSPYTRGLEAELVELQKASNGRIAETQLGQWLAGTKVSPPLPPTTTLLEPLPLNSEQRLAVQRGLTQPLTVITGPPGTGKSQVVTSLLVNAAYQGKRVLFASKNNKAVDVVEDRVNGLGPRPILLRTGANEYRTRLSDYLSNLLSATAGPDDQATFEEYQSSHDRLAGELERLEDKTKQLIAARNRLDELERQVEDARGIFGTDLFARLASFDPETVEPVLDQLVKSVREADRSKQSVLMRPFWSLVRNKRFDALSDAFAKAEPALSSLGIASSEIRPSDETIHFYRELSEAADHRLLLAKTIREYFDTLAQIKELSSLEDLASSHAELTQRLASNSENLWSAWVRLQPTKLTSEQRRVLRDFASILQLMVKADEENQRAGQEIFSKNRKLYPEVVKTLSCWAVTSLSARGRIPLEPGFFDILIIDEASQCDIASAIPLLYRAKSVVIIGDPNQLKHISSVPAFRDRQLLVKYDLIDSFASWSYSVTSLFDLASRFTEPGDIVSLRDHHRSHSDIISFSNEHFYEGRLRVATRYNRLKLPARDEPAVRWIPIIGEVRRPATGGAVNRTEAEAVIRTLSELVLDRGYRGSVGVVSPFRAQANLIHELATQNPQLFEALAALDFLADTVHSFQGDERDIMVFSPVVSRNMPAGGLGFLRSNRNLFNVAITRARAALWTVGDLHAALASDVDYLAAFARYTQELGREREPPSPGQDLGPDYPVVRNPEQVSDWERLFYVALYRAGIRSVPQYPEENYTLDFTVFDGERRLDIEIDGERYHKDWTGELCRRDLIRNQRLLELGWDVKRFWVYQVRDDLDTCVRWVNSWLNGSGK